MVNVLNSISGTYFSANIPDIVFSLTGEKAAVIMTVDGEIIYSEHLFPSRGIIKISDLPNLITPYAKQKLTVAFELKIKEVVEDGTQPSTVTMSANVIYCSADVDTTAEDFTSHHFLSLMLGKKTTAVGRLEYLHYIGTDTATVTASYDDGTTEKFTLTPVGGNSKYTTIEVSPALFAKKDKQLIRYTVVAGERLQMFVIDFKNPDCAPILIFDNSFGVEELIYCTGTETVSPSFKRESSYIEGIQKNYNIEETKTFKADTGYLSFDEANWAGDLFRSEYIRVVNFYSGVPNIGKEVIITESKLDYTNDYDEMPRFTFSYQYAQRNHNVLDLKREGRIFDNTFDNTFN